MDARSIAAVCDQLTTTGGFRLEPWREAWAGTLVEAWTDPDIARWNPVPPEPSIERASSWILSTASQNEASVGIDVVLVDDHSDTPAGEIGLQIDPAQAIAEIGFWLARPFRGRGIGQTLLSSAEELAKVLELRGLIALVDPANNAAISVCAARGWVEVPTRSHRRAWAYRAA